jgi:hypothetical protein
VTACLDAADTATDHENSSKQITAEEGKEGKKKKKEKKGRISIPAREESEFNRRRGKKKRRKDRSGVVSPS